jgi:lipoate-protein ligase A
VILVDNKSSTDPYINLAIEEFLVRHADCEGKDYLLLYANEPSIIVGKNQSIWKEINFEYLRNGKLKLCRRISGGGTVYHDSGNLNFAFVSMFAEHKINNYKLFNQPIVDALIRIGLKAEMDDRNNILCNGKKISGCAQFTDRKNIISHGTLLLNADLSVLRDCLKENDFKIETKAVESVRSSVMNIAETTSRFASVEDLKSFLAKELQAENVYQFNEEEWSTIRQSAKEKFSRLEWIYGRSPQTKIIKNGIEIEVEQGKITFINNDTLLSDALKESYYQFEEIKKALEDLSSAPDILRKVF